MNEASPSKVVYPDFEAKKLRTGKEEVDQVIRRIRESFGLEILREGKVEVRATMRISHRSSLTSSLQAASASGEPQSTAAHGSYRICKKLMFSNCHHVRMTIISKA